MSFFLPGSASYQSPLKGWCSAGSATWTLASASLHYWLTGCYDVKGWCRSWRICTSAHRWGPGCRAGRELTVLRTTGGVGQHRITHLPRSLSSCFPPSLPSYLYPPLSLTPSVSLLMFPLFLPLYLLPLLFLLPPPSLFHIFLLAVTLLSLPPIKVRMVLSVYQRWWGSGDSFVLNEGENSKQPHERIA